MSADDYSQLITAQFQCNTSVAESSHAYLFLTERHLQAMWLEQKYFKNLVTEDGMPIEVLSPGIWNGESGPDFLKAHLRIGEQEYRGDVELHISEESWYQHQHHVDSRYDDVVLHVSFWKPVIHKMVQTSTQRSIIRTHLKSFLTIPEARIVKLIDLDLYPYKHFVGSGLCARTLFNKLSETKTTSLFRSAATWRLIRKRQFLKDRVHNPEDSATAGFAMALGYKQNTEAFLEIFSRMKESNITQEQGLFALALGISGFFSEYHRQKWADSLYYQSLLSYFEGIPQSDRPSLISIRCDKVRPANHPIRRFAVLAKIVTDPSLKDLPRRLNSCWKSLWQERKWPQLRKELFALLPSYSDPYWEHHYTFETNAKPKSLALMGSDLQREIFINVCLPLLHEVIAAHNDPHEMAAFENFYGSIPASKTRKGVYLNHRFFGNTNRLKVFSHADLQQGAYQIHRDFCIHYEASCIGCPFVERYVNAFGN